MTDYQAPGIQLEIKPGLAPVPETPDIEAHLIGHLCQVAKDESLGAYDGTETGFDITGIVAGATLIHEKCVAKIRLTATGESVEIPEEDSEGVTHWAIDEANKTLTVMGDVYETTLDRSAQTDGALDQATNVFSSDAIDFSRELIVLGYTKLRIDHADYAAAGLYDIALQDDGTLLLVNEPVYPPGSATTDLPYTLLLSCEGDVYLDYYALRSDLDQDREFVTPSTLYDFLGNTDAIQPDNPIAFALYIITTMGSSAWVTCPDDVDGYREEMVDGSTDTADIVTWTNNFTYLKGFSFEESAYHYLILSQNIEVISVFELFIDWMRDPDQGKLAIGWASIKDHETDELVASVACLAQAGGTTDFNTTSDYTDVCESGNILEITDPDGVVTTHVIVQVVAGAPNKFVVNSNVPSTILATWSFRVYQDLRMMEQAAYYKQYASAFANEAFRLCWPGTIDLLFNGETYTKPSYYWFAYRLAVLCLQYDISQPQTNIPVSWALFHKSNLTYKVTEFLDMIASGGIEIIMQERDDAPLKSRHCLTTDMTSVASREQSMAHQYDYAARLLRLLYEPYMGNTVIDDNTISKFKVMFSAATSKILKRALSKLRLVSLEPWEEDDTWLYMVVEATAKRPCNGMRIVLYQY